jgi:hypothetical protein
VDDFCLGYISITAQNYSDIEQPNQLLIQETPEINYVLGAGAGHYTYAPSAIQDNYKIRYVFLCENKNPFEIVDYLYLHKGIPTKDGYLWQKGTPVLAPSEEGWDKIHVCDPDVREFKTIYKGETYNWIMVYLGVDQWNNHNQIGFSFSKNIEGPYTKYDKNPLITYEDKTILCLGQSTSIVLDSTTIRIFYSKSPRAMQVRDIKLNNLDLIVLGPERMVQHLLPNTYFALSESYIYAVSEIRNNMSDEIPTWVGNETHMFYKPLTDDLFDEQSEWVKIGSITPKNSNFPRNHNPGFLTDTKGYMISDKEAVVYFTTAMTGENWLWSYDLYSAIFDIDFFKKTNFHIR